jgi:hypothetical protein
MAVIMIDGLEHVDRALDMVTFADEIQMATGLGYL